MEGRHPARRLPGEPFAHRTGKLRTSFQAIIAGKYSRARTRLFVTTSNRRIESIRPLVWGQHIFETSRESNVSGSPSRVVALTNCKDILDAYLFQEKSEPVS